MARKTLQDFAQMSLDPENFGSHSCDLKLDVNGQTWVAYEVSIAHGDLLFFTEKGCATYLVDNYGGEAVVTLHDWEENE